MSVKLRVRNVRVLARIALLGAAAGLLAGCSSEVTRFGEGVMPTPDTVFQEGDLLNVIVLDKQADRSTNTLGQPPGEST